MRKFLGAVELFFTIASIVTYTGGPLVVILSGGISEGEVGAAADFGLVKQVFQANYVISLILLAVYWKKALYLLTKDKLLLLLLGVISCSVIWSTAPDMTINRSVALIGTSIFGFYLTTRYSLRQQLYLLGWSFGAIIVLSIVFALALPKYGVMGGVHAGAWRGIYTHKNGLGATMSLSAIVFLILAVDSKRWFFWLGCGLSTFLLLLSRASSPLINLIILLIAFSIFQTLRWKYNLRAIALSLISAFGYMLAILAIQQAENLAGVVGKDLTLTGRTELWDYAWEMICRRPWLGYGYGSLWSSWDSETAPIWRAVGWTAPNSHSGFLELWLNLGLLGVAIVLLHFLIHLFKSLSLVSQSKTPEFFLPLMFMLYTLLVNLTEAVFLDRNSIHWVLYVSLALSLQLRSNQGLAYQDLDPDLSKPELQRQIFVS